MTQKQFRSWLKIRLAGMTARSVSLDSRNKKRFRVKDADMIQDLELLSRAAKQRAKLVK